MIFSTEHGIIMDRDYYLKLKTKKDNHALVPWKLIYLCFFISPTNKKASTQLNHLANVVIILHIPKESKQTFYFHFILWSLFDSRKMNITIKLNYLFPNLRIYWVLHMLWCYWMEIFILNKLTDIRCSKHYKYESIRNRLLSKACNGPVI